MYRIRITADSCEGCSFSLFQTRTPNLRKNHWCVRETVRKYLHSSLSDDNGQTKPQSTPCSIPTTHMANSMSTYVKHEQYWTSVDSIITKSIGSTLLRA